MRYGAGGQGAQKAGMNVTMTGAGANNALGKWEPTTVFLLVTVAAELTALVVMRKVSRHGG